MYLTDYATLLMCLIFSIFSFFTIGTFRLHLLEVSIDRGFVFGFVYLICFWISILLVKLLHGSQNRLLSWFRIFYPLLFFFLFFQESIYLSNWLYHGRSFDAAFVSLETSIFGFQPALEFYRVMPDSRAFVELMFFSYFLFYLLFSGVFWILFLIRRDKEAVEGFTFICFAFFLMYLFYIFFPVKGPKYYFPELQTLWYSNFKGFFITDLMKILFNRVNLAGAAFPSSHAAIALYTLFLGFSYKKILGYLFLPFVLLLLVSTVYLYAHYVVDIAAGCLLAVVFYFTIPKLVSMTQNMVDKIRRIEI